jgi:hypothetical protein
MKTVLDFPVVGSNYTTVDLTTLLDGEELTLVPEPTNQYDQYAVAVYRNTEKIGYVPNKGRTCTECWSSVPSRSDTCPKCLDYENVVEGGLAFRMTSLNIFSKNHLCYIQKIDLSNSMPIQATLLIDNYGN